MSTKVKYFQTCWKFCKNFLPLPPANLSVAQLVEQLTLNQWVAGSSPAGETYSSAKCKMQSAICHFAFYVFQWKSRKY